MLSRLLLATGNQGKLRELRELLAGDNCQVLGPADVGGLPQVVEDGLTFEENAVKKARSAAQATGMPTLADDSGLLVDALGGAPGVISARYAGEAADDQRNNDKLLAELRNVPAEQRTASFQAVLALCYPDGNCRTFVGTISGLILDAPRGSDGFGYDPLFYLPEHDATFAELPLSLKNRISHRGRAMAQLQDFLRHED